MKMIQLSAVNLVDALREYIESAIKELRLPAANKSGDKQPQVISGYLPEKKPIKQQVIPDIPFVIVRYLGDEGNAAKIKLLIAVYSEEETEGWRDLLRVMERMKISLLKQRIIGRAFRLAENSIKLEMLEEQPYPAWYGIITCNYELPPIVEEGYQELL